MREDTRYSHYEKIPDIFTTRACYSYKRCLSIEIWSDYLII